MPVARSITHVSPRFLDKALKSHLEIMRREYALPFIVLLPQWFGQAGAFHHLFLKVITPSKEKYLDELARPYF
jgi:hypothetical protein